MHSAAKLQLPLGLVVLLVGAAGCNRVPAELADVTGVVTFYGEPFSADVLFEPLDENYERVGRPSTGATDDRGRFALSFTPDADGAIVGWHRVTVKIMKPATKQGENTATHAWNELKTVRLLRQVQPGDNHFVFALSL